MNFIEVHHESKLLFAIPIYVRSLQEWQEDYKIKEKECLDSCEKAWKRAGSSMPSKKRIESEVRFNQSAQLWHYNEIIAFIEIRCHKGFLYGFLLKSVAKCYSPSLKNKQIKPDYSSTCQLRIDREANIRRLMGQIIETILKRHRRLRNRFVDTEIIDHIAPILDLDKLLRSCSQNIAGN